MPCFKKKGRKGLLRRKVRRIRFKKPNVGNKGIVDKRRFRVGNLSVGQQKIDISTTKLRI